MYGRLFLGTCLAIMFCSATAQAKHSCSLTIKFENKTTGNAAGKYRMAIKLGKSKVKAKGGFYVPVSSKATIWSPKLKVGASAVKTVKANFHEPCWRRRTFRFHTCWKKIGTPGKATCRTGISTGRAESGSWRVHYTLERNPVRPANRIMRTTGKTNEKKEAASPFKRRCKLTFNIKNVGGGLGANISVALSRGKVKAKNGQWVKMPEAKWEPRKYPTNRYKAGERKRHVAVVYFRASCKRKRLFRIPVCFKGRGWSVPAKCTTIGGRIGGKKLRSKSGPYTFDIEATKFRYSKRIKLTRFN